MSVEAPEQPDILAMWAAVALPQADPNYVDPALLVVAENRAKDVRAALVAANHEVRDADSEVSQARWNYGHEVRSQRDMDRLEADHIRISRQYGVDAEPIERDLGESARVADARNKIGEAIAAREELNELHARTTAVNSVRNGKRVGRAATLLAVAPAAVFGAAGTVGTIEVFAALAVPDSAASQYNPAPAPTATPRPPLPSAPPGVKYEYGPDGTMIVTSTVTEDESATAVNPLARTCEPTGAEEAADRPAAQQTIDAVKALGEDVQVTRVDVEGVADDSSGSDPNAGLGIPDAPGTGNDCRGKMRGQVGERVLTQVAAANGVVLNNVVTTGGENVLNGQELAEIDRIAQSLGLKNRNQLVTSYNIDRAGVAGRVSADDMKILDAAFFRGVTYKVTVSRQVQETRALPQVENPITEVARDIKNAKWLGISAEAFAAGLSGFLGGMLGLFGSDKLQGHVARWAARRQVAKIRAEKAVATGSK